jgi:hypothetical protein
MGKQMNNYEINEYNHTAKAAPIVPKIAIYLYLFRLRC